MKRQFEMEWSDFGTTIRATLLEGENPEVCKAFVDLLPFTTIFAASMSAGEMFKVPIPSMLPDADIDRLAPLPDEPEGSIFSLGYGSLLVKYGIVVEPFRLARIGIVEPDELANFQSISAKLADAYFFTKDINHVTFRLKD
ncbi:MAG: DUF3830 family protein [Gammaproteobacteria bacterium]|nr:DUF3830 family protein [Gammaproteobacteria bacterium]MBT8443136.1 DUF3830 family protein [Gammaproteobacteria bacterium]